MKEAKLFLSNLLHVSLGDLEKALLAKYKQKSISKRSGGIRILHIPEKPLLFIQRRLLKSLLYRIVLPNCFHGFRKKHSIVTNANNHLGNLFSRYWFKVDLKDAFPSVKEIYFRNIIEFFLKTVFNFRLWRNLRVTRMLHRRYNNECRAGISIDGWPNDKYWMCQKIENDLSILESKDADIFQIIRKLFRQLSKTNPIFAEKYKSWLNGSETTYNQGSLFEKWEPKLGFEDFLRDVFEIILKLTFYDGTLPQGAPSSPYLLNRPLSKVHLLL